MPDDLFSRLFELFNQPGPVNWKLAGEVAHHLAGEQQAVDPWAAEQVVELGSFARAQIEEKAPFPVPISPISVVDRRQWVDEALQRLAYVADVFAETGSQLVPGMGAALAGMQVGTLAGTIASTTVGAYEAGIPLEGGARLLVIGSGLETLEATLGVDSREVRLGVVASEIAHAALFQIPWLIEHLSGLIGAYATHLVPDPEKLMALWGDDPESLAAKLGDPTALEELTGGEEAVTARQALEAFLSITGGYRQMLVSRSFPHMLPSLARLHATPTLQAPLFTLPLATPQSTTRGASFCQEVQRRYGLEALENIWLGPERLPSHAEIGDPLGWAARVLLEELGP